MVTLASILLPGAGYLLLGQRKRALAAGGGVLALVLLSVLLAGIRVFSVPGYDEYGQAVYLEVYPTSHGLEGRRTITPVVRTMVVGTDSQNRPIYEIYRRQHDGTVQKSPDEIHAPLSSGWVLLNAPFATLGEAPSIIAHAFTGPIYLVGSYISIQIARQEPPNPTVPPLHKAYLRLADVASMYLVVAGMLNLMVIADSYARATQKEAHA
jgi:hypothetical protein